MSKEKEVPGLTLHIVEDTLSSCSGQFKATGRILLAVEVMDFDIFEAVKERLDGMTVYTVNDIPQALVAAAQRRAMRAEEDLMRNTEENRQQVDELESRLSFAEAEMGNYKSQLDMALQRAGDMLKINSALQETIDWQDKALESRSNQ